MYRALDTTCIYRRGSRDLAILVGEPRRCLSFISPASAGEIFAIAMESVTLLHNRKKEMKLSLLGKPVKSPFPSSPHIAELQLDSPSQLLSWAEVVDLHETARELCPQRFSWWCGLPPELWIVSQIAYCFQAPTMEELPNVYAMRISLQADYQFSGASHVLLTLEQLITLRKVCYRIRSDFYAYAKTGALPTEFDWSDING
ncbi:MAG: hypothetical protein F6K00_33850 [Leptolyngbya sp. SIOISBB]|nr:hypothetical protein [Leptolyngbya sp. SIOISBB]